MHFQLNTHKHTPRFENLIAIYRQLTSTLSFGSVKEQSREREGKSIIEREMKSVIFGLTWNQVFTCASVILRPRASAARSADAKYFCL
jgi:hypothetical protein